MRVGQKWKAAGHYTDIARSVWRGVKIRAPIQTKASPP